MGQAVFERARVRRLDSPSGMAVAAKATGDWHDVNTWVRGTIPRACDDVTIVGFTVTTQAKAECRNLTVGSASQTAVSGLVLNADLKIHGNIVFVGSSTDLTTVNPKSNTITTWASTWSHGNGASDVHYFVWGDGTGTYFYWMAAVQPTVIFKRSCAFTYHKVSSGTNEAACMLYFCKSFTLDPDVTLTLDMDANSSEAQGHDLYWQLPGGTFRMGAGSTIQNGDTYSKCGIHTVWDGTNTHDIGANTTCNVSMYFGIACWDGSATNQTQDLDWSGCAWAPRRADGVMAFGVHHRLDTDAAPGDTATFRLTGDWIIHPSQNFRIRFATQGNPAGHLETYAVLDPNGYTLEVGDHSVYAYLSLGNNNVGKRHQHGRLDFSGNGGVVRVKGKSDTVGVVEFEVRLQDQDGVTGANDLRIDLGTAGVLELIDADFKDLEAGAGGTRYASAGGYIYWKVSASLSKFKDIWAQDLACAKLPLLKVADNLGTDRFRIRTAARWQAGWILEAGAVLLCDPDVAQIFDENVYITGPTSGTDAVLKRRGAASQWDLDAFHDLLADTGNYIQLTDCNFTSSGGGNLQAQNADDLGNNSDATIDGRAGEFGD